MSTRVQIPQTRAAAAVPHITPTPFGTLQRQCACGGSGGSGGECEKCKKKKETTLQRRAIGNNKPATIPPIVDNVLRSPGQSLDPSTRAFFEPRFGHDFSRVRIHAGSQAAESASAVRANAYTAGWDIVFGAAQYAPGTRAGNSLLAHELTHVVQQGAQGRLAAQSLTVSSPSDAAEVEANRAADEVLMEPGPGGPRNISARIAQRVSRTIQRQTDAGQKPDCAPDPSCPPEYCTPFATTKEAEDDRAANAESVLGWLPLSRTRPLFREYIFGGGPPRDISADFAADFTNSESTIATTRLLSNSLEDSIKASPPTFPPGATDVTLYIEDVLSGTINQIMEKMIFSNPLEVPGLLAGGIGKNQFSCRVGAIPSSQDDARFAEGTVSVTKNADGSLSISPPTITFTVQDTLDFCPGFCGSGWLALSLTVPMSRWEASKISGDVPFTVQFPAPIGSAGSEE